MAQRISADAPMGDVTGSRSQPTEGLSLRDFFSPERGDTGTPTESSASLRPQQLREQREPRTSRKPVVDRKQSRKGKARVDGLDERCRKLLAELERRCPGLLPTGPLPAGEVTDPIEIKQEDLENLILKAVGVSDKRKRNTVIWEQAGSELLVHLKKTRIAVLDGMVLVGLTVQTIETETVEVTVPFAVGRPDRLAGMVVTAEAQPRGPAAIVDLWGEALTAAAWQALLDVISTIAARTGVDDVGRPLLPGAIMAAPGRLGVVPQAAHVFEGST